MSTTATASKAVVVEPTSTISKDVNVIVQPTPFYKTFSFWIILIAIIILIIIGALLFYFAPTPAGGFTLIGFYIFAIILLIIGILIAIMT